MATLMLEMSQLQVRFGRFTAVDGVDLSVSAGEVLGVVGESGSGKSVAMMALMGLVDAPGEVRATTLRFDGQDLLTMSPAQRRRCIGRDMAMVFQDALASLNPSYTIGFQIEEVLRHHLGLRGRAAREQALALLRQVEIPDPERRLDAYPHELSGGMNQRVMIALAIACSPKLLIADEPTTALDVTIQAQVMDLLLRLQRERDMALVMITHDLAVVAEMAQRVAVLYAGQVVETGPLPQVFDQPRHPYTAALLAAIPEHRRSSGDSGGQGDSASHAGSGGHDGSAGSGDGRGDADSARHRRLPALPGMVPGASDRPSGCLFAPRCPQVRDRCRSERPALEAGVRCFFPLNGPAAHPASGGSR
ncbi:dipeptide ABC transporter ATP-binding protein DppD [Roseateles terrae]|uniref:Dipeptide transport system ATP-binding protein n=1 Tax=Roseateles terrae TaxID=431060 RepID=A0ABR6GUK7_9BURK|nr:ABC transporter ATP-binding protein [Roseateles terrae]MBB3194833.1 dipeptide transport system ATP-binding protein [Roseateles terrae]OWQ85901.1 dipeptide ABC transporter ATP-binding protein DppD [Roseateles terrae]